MSSADKLTSLRNSTEHVLTMAMENLYGKNVVKAMGPSIEDGFYFDFDSPQDFKLAETDFPKIEKEMHRLIALDLPISIELVSPQTAKAMFKSNPYKQELIKTILDKGDKKIRIVTIGKKGTDNYFPNICKDQHLKSTGAIKAFKLLSLAGAYWHGDEKNKMLTRIYGTAFPSKKELDQYLNRLEEAKSRDHRQLGKDLNLFTFSDLVGKGLPLFTAKGATIWRELERFVVDEEIKRGYQHVRTPSLAKTDLYKKSGHYPYYQDTMYPPMKIDEEELILRPMTCPHHFMLYLSQPRSYRDLPIRYAEMASQYRYEKSGELTGLIRVRKFCLADSHIFVRKQQAAEEINSVLDLIEFISSTLGLKKGQDYRYRLSLGDRANKDKYFNAPQEWQSGENLLKQVLDKRQAPFFEAPDEAAFYGPKIDIQMKNIVGKEDTAFTVQYDFCLPQRFNLVYTNEKGKDEQPIVIHRSSLGALERSIGFLIEHYAGAFPVWLAPIQVVIVPVSKTNLDYAKKVHQQLKAKNVRAELDSANETLGAKIRQASTQKIPYILVVGNKEAQSQSVNKRKRGSDLAPKSVKLDQFIKDILQEIDKKTIN